MNDRKPDKIIRLAFTDFGDDFANQNWFKSFLSQHFEINICDANPDAVMFSDFGDDYLRYPCTRIYYTGENSRPDFSRCDYAFTFDYCDDPRHYRLPLYRLYFNERDMTVNRNAEAILAQNRKFCGMVASNAKTRERIDFFHELSSYKQLDSGGKVLNNIGGPVPDKRTFLRNYRFALAFENSSSPGYTTEQIVEAWIEGCIPIYWGNPRIADEFNPHSYIDLTGYSSWDMAIERVREIDSNPRLMLDMLKQPLLTNNIVPEFLREKNIAQRFEAIFSDGRDTITLRRKFDLVLYAAKRLKRKMFAGFTQTES